VNTHVAAREMFLSQHAGLLMFCTILLRFVKEDNKYKKHAL
jgi:hypothetical protein